MALENGDKAEYNIGFRDFVFDPEQGFVANGKRVKLHGVCEHHDLGCLGAAFHKKAMARKIATLKKMGVNANRTSHNMPAPELMDLADTMGMYIVSEASAPLPAFVMPDTSASLSVFVKPEISASISSLKSSPHFFVAM